METRTISITLENAREWYNSGNATLRALSLRAFSEEELRMNYRSIRSFKDACELLQENFDKAMGTYNAIRKYSVSSAALFQLSIIHKALTVGYTMSLMDDQYYKPCLALVSADSQYFEEKASCPGHFVIGNVEYDGKRFAVLTDGVRALSYSGIGSYSACDDVCYAYEPCTMLACPTREIARHLGLYFGMLIVESMYGDIEKK